MCGLFGMLRPDGGDACPSAAILRLGELAEERGFDAAGLAWTDPAAGQDANGQNRNRWQVRRQTGPFSELETRIDLDSLDRATLVLGHTRWATQGGRTVLQAGPNSVGQVIGTHNGDLDIATLPADRRPVGERTDSELLFAAIDAHTSNRAGAAGGSDELVDVFTAMRGRAALVWALRVDGERVQLLRAGLSPLAVGYDNDGRLWWASNPGWLRQLDAEQHIGIHRIVMLTEGELWQARVRQDLRRGRRVRMSRLSSFVPVVRVSDVRIARIAVWRGFSSRDAAHDKARLRHRIETRARPAHRLAHRPARPTVQSSLFREPWAGWVGRLPAAPRIGDLDFDRWMAERNDRTGEDWPDVDIDELIVMVDQFKLPTWPATG